MLRCIPVVFEKRLETFRKPSEGRLKRPVVISLVWLQNKQLKHDCM